MTDFPTSSPTRTAHINTLMPDVTPTLGPGITGAPSGPTTPAAWGAASGRLFPRHSLPTTSTGVKEVDDAIDHFEQYVAEFQEAAGVLTGLRSNGARKRAEAADAAAAAAAIESGKPDPGPVNVDRHRDALTNATRKRDALNLVLQRADSNLQRAVKKHARALHAHAEKNADDRRKAAEKALAELAPALDELGEFIRLGVWATNFPNYRGRRWNKPFFVPAAGSEIHDLIRWIRDAMDERPEPPGGAGLDAGPVPDEEAA